MDGAPPVHGIFLLLEFSRQEYWSGLPFSPLGDLFNPGIEPTSLTSSALAARFFTTGKSQMGQTAEWLIFLPLQKKYLQHYEN